MAFTSEEDPISVLRTDVRETAAQEASVYRHGEDRPLGGYVSAMAVFAAFVVGGAGLFAASSRRLPDRPAPYDVVLIAVGTHKLSRTLTKDAVTSPLRAPFTRYVQEGAPSEVSEEPRKDSQFRHAIGELLTCPFCLDMWIAAGFTLGLVYSPRITRLVAGTLSAVTGADFLQLAYARAQSG